MSTQLVRMQSAVNQFLKDPEGADYLLVIRRILNEAQNPPPQGTADGSINDETWTRYRKFLDAAQTMQGHLQNLRHYGML